LKIHLTSALILLAVAGTTFGQPGAAAEPLDWKTLEAPMLSGHVQITSRDMFVKAGEAYFSPDSSWIIFQAIPVPPAGQRPDDFYSMYVARIVRDDAGEITGLDEPILISPPGSANTCGWFHPQAPWRVLFGSTLVPPVTDQGSGFQVGTRRYVWLFPQETDIVTRTVVQILEDAMPDSAMYALAADAKEPVPLVSGPDYHAEASWSPCGRFVLYAAVRPERTDGRADADLWIYDTETRERHPIVVAPGYDGGPFFSPDGRRICYRSDRKLNDRLQIFVADLKFENGVPVGIEREYQLTDNAYVNWAPFWHPSGDFLVYASSEAGHWNYEIYAVQADAKTFRSGV
jgi:TolB protein